MLATRLGCGILIPFQIGATVSSPISCFCDLQVEVTVTLRVCVCVLSLATKYISFVFKSEQLLDSILLGTKF